MKPKEQRTPVERYAFAIALAFASFTAGCDDEDSSRMMKQDAAVFGNLDAAAGDAPVLVGNKDGAVSDAAALDAPSLDATLAEARASDTSLGDGGLQVSDVVGYYSGDWGDMVLKEVNGEIWASYTHDQGTVVGTWVDGVLKGWWSEVPSRLPSNDAGEVEFRFVIKNNVVAIDGRWKYGVDDVWREDWDVSLVKLASPPALVARFEDPTLFKRHP